ncbi:hypothetical protein BHE74_00026085 [Ensete ventricosum]|nr:hypothetical protein BHE74_00026085 [Ensete ventricosum]
MDGSEETQARFDALALYASELRANGSTRCLSESPFLSPLTPYFPSPISPFPSRAATELRRQSPGSAAGATFRRPPSGEFTEAPLFFPCWGGWIQRKGDILCFIPLWTLLQYDMHRTGPFLYLVSKFSEEVLD